MKLTSVCVQVHNSKKKEVRYPKTKKIHDRRPLAIRLVQWLGWVLEAQERKKEWSIAGVPSIRALPGFPITAPHLCAFLL